LKGVGDLQIAVLILAVISVTIVASVFSSTTINSLSYNYLVYDFLVSHHLSYIQNRFGMVRYGTEPKIEGVEGITSDNIRMLIYDLKEKEVVYSEVGKELEEKLIEKAKNVPEKPGDNVPCSFLGYGEEKMEEINKEMYEFCGSYYSQPVIIDRGSERNPGLLIILSYNLNLAEDLKEGKGVTQEAIEWVQKEVS